MASEVRIHGPAIPVGALRSALKSWFLGSTAARIRSTTLAVDPPWTVATYFLYQRLYALEGHDRLRLLAVYLPFALIKTLIMIVILPRTLRPMDRWLEARQSSDEVLLAGAKAVFRFRDSFALIIAIPWGILCPCCTLVMSLLYPEVMPPLGVSLPIAITMGLAQFISTWMHGATAPATVVGREMALVSEEASRRGLTIPVRQIPYNVLLLLLSVGFALVPTLWMTCIGYMIWYRNLTAAAPQPLHTLLADRFTLFYFMALMLAWVLPLSFFLSRGLVFQVKEIAAAVRRAAEAGQAAAAGRVPVYTLDELGKLAESVNFMVSRLAEAEVRILGQMRELRALDELKDQFLRVAAHELKTPVSIVKGYSQLLMRRAGDLPEDLRPLFASIDRGADRMSGLIENFLSITELQMGRLPMVFEPLDLAATTRNAVAEARRRTPEQPIHVSAESPQWVRGDRLRLEQVVAALIDNAVKFSPARGEIEVEVAPDADGIVLMVRDHGVGIPAAKQARIFETFYRAHTDTPFDYGGLGIGLYLARETVLCHEGKVGFVSEEGKGSTFFVRLPRLPEP